MQLFFLRGACPCLLYRHVLTNVWYALNQLAKYESNYAMDDVALVSLELAKACLPRKVAPLVSISAQQQASPGGKSLVWLIDGSGLNASDIIDRFFMEVPQPRERAGQESKDKGRLEI